LRDDGLFDVTTASVRLDPEHVTSDVSEFLQAIDRNELERAVELYQGPFLDGFFVTGAPEFEQWSSAQRTRLRDLAVGALEKLAADADASGDLASVVRWRRQAAALLPLDAPRTVRLMTAMAAAGDRAGAIKHARVHAALLRQELGLDVDPTVDALETTLRAETDADRHDRADDDGERRDRCDRCGRRSVRDGAERRAPGGPRRPHAGRREPRRAAWRTRLPSFAFRSGCAGRSCR
jgi:serine/threonine-protein kinase